MRGFEKLEAAVLHVRNVAPHQLELEHVAVVRAAKQHRLAPQQHAALARCEHLRDHVVRLRLVVGHGDVARPLAGSVAATAAPCGTAASPSAISAFAASSTGWVER